MICNLFQGAVSKFASWARLDWVHNSLVACGLLVGSFALHISFCQLTFLSDSGSQMANRSLATEAKRRFINLNALFRRGQNSKPTKFLSFRSTDIDTKDLQLVLVCFLMQFKQERLTEIPERALRVAALLNSKFGTQEVWARQRRGGEGSSCPFLLLFSGRYDRKRLKKPNCTLLWFMGSGGSRAAAQVYPAMPASTFLQIDHVSVISSAEAPFSPQMALTTMTMGCKLQICRG